MKERELPAEQIIVYHICNNNHVKSYDNFSVIWSNMQISVLLCIGHYSIINALFCDIIWNEKYKWSHLGKGQNQEAQPSRIVQ